MTAPNLIIATRMTVKGMARRSQLSPGALLINVHRPALARDGTVVTTTRALLIYIAAYAGRPGHILSDAEVADLLYGDRADGGPIDVRNLLRVNGVDAWPILALLGLRLDRHHGRGSALRSVASPRHVEAA